MWMFFLLPFMGAFIGYATNVLAIKSLFRPHKPKRVLFWEIQGLLPRHRESLAQNVGQALEKNLLTPEDMALYWEQLGLEAEVERVFRAYLEGKLTRHLNILPKSLLESIMSGLERLFQKDIHQALEEVRKSLTHHLQEEIHIGDMVAEKIRELDIIQVETLVFKVVHRELRYVELAGGVLGFLVGLLQAVLVLVFGQ